MSANAWRPRPALLLVPFAVSLAPWLLSVTLLRATGEEVEGGMLGTSSIGAIVSADGTASGSRAGDENAIGFWKFAGLFFFVSAPTLAYRLVR